MAKVFISYARGDARSIADRLAARLGQLDHEPWLDRSEILGGTDWSRTVETAIDECDVLLAVLTQGSFVSAICRGEQARALRKGRPVLPLLAAPDADRPVYLETAHYLDFSDPSLFEASFSDLAGRIDSGDGLRLEHLSAKLRDVVAISRPLESMAAAFGGRSASWSDVRAMAATSRRQFLDVVEARGGRPGVYDQGLYVRRPTAEQELDRFTAGDAPALVLLGGSGVGKTNLLCDWTGRLAEEGHAVLSYHGAKLRSSVVTADLARDLRLEDAAEVPAALALADDLARQEGRRLFIIFDGINEFRGRDGEGTRDLLDEIDALVAHLPGEDIRVLLSSSTPAWTRLDRAGDLRLSWGRYHLTLGDEEVLILGVFSEAEAEEAYRRYGLRPALPDLPGALRARLREPLLLRFFAETGQSEESRDEGGSDEEIFRRYFTDRVHRRADVRFVDDLVAEMRRAEQPSLSLNKLSSHEVLGSEIDSDDPEGPYRRLLDAGVLLEVAGKDPMFDDDVVGFAYPMIGAYALARHQLRQGEPIEVAVRNLVSLSGKLPFSLGAAETLLVERGEDALFKTLAQSEDVELRELAVEALTSLARSSTDRAQSLLRELLQSEATLANRTALRAAYAIGPVTRGLFMEAAMSQSDTLRQVARDTLYLIWTGTTRAGRGSTASDAYFLWRHAPDFTYGLLGELVARMTWRRPRQTYRIWRFVLDLLITIYINHCDRQEVAAQTAETFYELAVNRLHLDRLRLGSRVEGATLRVVSGVFSRRILDWMLVSDTSDHRAFFDRSKEERKLLAELAPLLDPDVDVGDREDLLSKALGSELDVVAGSAALVLAVHAHEHFDRTQTLLRQLFEGLGERGRLWQLMGLSVLLPTTPSGWVPLLEDFTRTLIRDDPSLKHGGLGVLESFNLFFVPLGLAYGKRGNGMPLYDELIGAGGASVGSVPTARVIEGLGPVGFYYPKATLAILARHTDALLAEPESVEALVTALGTIRRLHVDVVDAFMLRLAGGQNLRWRVAAAADAQRIDRFVHLLGYYNNAVHYCVSYPRMRRDLGMFALRCLAEAEDANDFVVEYSEQALRMARAANFDLLEWTSPDEPPAPDR